MGIIISTMWDCKTGYWCDVREIPSTHSIWWTAVFHKYMLNWKIKSCSLWLIFTKNMKQDSIINNRDRAWTQPLSCFNHLFRPIGTKQKHKIKVNKTDNIKTFSSLFLKTYFYLATHSFWSKFLRRELLSSIYCVYGWLKMNAKFSALANQLQKTKNGSQMGKIGVPWEHLRESSTNMPCSIRLYCCWFYAELYWHLLFIDKQLNHQECADSLPLW